MVNEAEEPSDGAPGDCNLDSSGVKKNSPEAGRCPNRSCTLSHKIAGKLAVVAIDCFSTRYSNTMLPSRKTNPSSHAPKK